MLASIGTVSQATMRNEDLIPCFVDLLDELNESRSLEWSNHFADELVATKEFSRLQDILASIERNYLGPTDDEISEYWDSEDASEDCNTLFDELNAFAPDYCYFGANEGDGSDYGFWPSMDSIQDAIHDGDILAVDDTGDVPSDYSGTVSHTSDHGNLTLYSANNGKLTELWAIV